MSGGSAANTIIGAASLGCRAAFIGKLKADEAGTVASVIETQRRAIETVEFEERLQKLEARLPK